MSATRRISALAIGFCLAAISPGAFAQDDCASLEKAFNAAVAKKSIEEAEAAKQKWVNDFVCGEKADEIEAKFLVFLIQLAEQEPSKQPIALQKVLQRVGVLQDWRIAERLGDYYWRAHNSKQAYEWYENSLNFLKEHPKEHPSAKEVQELYSRAGAAKSGEGGSQVAQAGFHQTRAAMDGTLGGIYVRQVVPVSVPLPVRFYYNEARPTPEGEAALKELAEAVKQQNLRVMKLVGHTDPRGSDAFNMELSRQRVEFVRDALQRQGVRAHVEISWQGKRQPIDVSVLAAPPENDEQLFALERRVEWIREGGE